MGKFGTEIKDANWCILTLLIFGSWNCGETF